MKTLTKLTLSIALAFLAAFQMAQAATFTNYDSIVSLATNVTKNYTFTDTNGASVVVAVTMTPFSGSNASPVFTFLDDSSNGPTHLGIDSGLGGSDATWVDPFEGVNFTASLLSSSGVITNSIQFSISGVGIRPNGSVNLQWVSPTTTNAFAFTATSEQLWTLDNTGAFLAVNAYAGELRTTGTNQYQLSDAGALAGKSVVLQVSFVEGNGAPVITQNPGNLTDCSGDQVTLTAVAYGDPNPTVQWEVSTNSGASFANVPGATNSTLIFLSTLAETNNQYEAVFTNSLGSATTTAATVAVVRTPATPAILTSNSFVPYTTNTALAPFGEDYYHWNISNATIIKHEESQQVYFVPNGNGPVTLTLLVGLLYGNTQCFVGNSITIPLAPAGASGGPGIYVSDDSDVIEKFDNNGVGSLFAYTGSGPTGTAFDPAGNLYVVDFFDGTITKFDTNGLPSYFATDTNTAAEAIAFDYNGNLLVTDSATNTITRFDTNGVGSVFISSTNLNSPDGLAYDSSGYLYVANYNDGTIWKFDINTNGTLFATNIPNACGMAFDTASNLFVADYDDSIIWKINTNGIGSIYATNNLNNPNGVAFDGAGNLYAANAGDGTVAKFARGSTNSTLLTANGMFGAEFAAVWPLPSQLIPTLSAKVSSAKYVNNQFQLSVTGISGLQYVVQYVSIFPSRQWVSIYTNAAPFTFVDTNATVNPPRFYRIILQ